MGGGKSKQQQTIKEEPLQVQEIQEEEVIQTYKKPESPLMTGQVKKLEIEEDPQINKEPQNKQNLDRQKSESQNSKQRKSNSDINKIDNQYEKGMENLKLSDIQELERKIMEDDISPINNNKTPSEKSEPDEIKKQKDLDKIAKAALIFNDKFSKELGEFNWGNQGQVKIISVSFKYQYNPKNQRLQLSKPYNTYINSLMQWNKNNETKVYEFNLIDTDAYDISSGIVTQLEHNEVQFMVDFYGNFVINIGIKNESQFIKKLKKGAEAEEKEIRRQEREREQLFEKQLSNLERIQHEKLNPQKQKNKKTINIDKIIRETEKQLRLIWNSSVQSWLGVNKVENEHLIIGNTNFQGQKCLLTNLSKEQEREKIEQFLRSKLEQPQFFKQCFESKRTIRDTLKKWGAFNQEEELAYLHEQRYARDIIKLQKSFNFPLAEKYEMTSGIIDELDFKPQVITMDNSKQVVIEYDRDLFVDIEHERKLMVFIWEQQLNQKVRSESIFVEELNKFRETCDYQLKQTIFDLSMIPTFPMPTRPKFKERYFQI